MPQYRRLHKVSLTRKPGPLPRYGRFISGIFLEYTMYQRKANVDMLNAVKSVLADVSSVSPSSEQRGD